MADHRQTPTNNFKIHQRPTFDGMLVAGIWSVIVVTLVVFTTWLIV